jgi:hypothetical protein
MSSCTNSSNIQSSLVTQVIREEGDGKRVAFKISTADAGITSGVTLGSVIRYDVALDSYELSSADAAAKAEVIGIVESIVGGVYTVVASGLINYPNINSVINRYDAGCATGDPATGGDEGGADIFFLSDNCPGKLQLLEPTTSGRIVKPVMQRVAVGSYNGIVLNYIGYEVADSATTDSTSIMPASSIYYAPPSVNITGFIDASEPQIVSTQSYPDLYDALKTNYGPYEETLTLQSPSVNLNTLINSTATQKNSYNATDIAGKVVSADNSNNKITIRKDSNQSKTDLTRKVSIGSFKFSATASTVSAFTVPSVPKQVINYTSSEGTKAVTLTPYMRAKTDVTSVFIPDIVQLSKLTCDNITTGGITVGTKLGDLETRLQNIERRVGI